ncbi:hypothetical protein [Methanospirillum hungatei]|nr:hypothetical protein [Methanospirillum hungatei]
MNVETAQTARSDVGRGIKAIISEFAFQADLTIPEEYHQYPQR